MKNFTNHLQGERSGHGGRCAGIKISAQAFVAAVFCLAGLGGPSVAPAAAQEAGAFQELDFRPITVDEAVDIALRRNPGLLQSALALEQAEHSRLSAVGSLLPSLSMNYRYSKSSSAVLDFTQQSFARTSYSTGVSASYNLFDGWGRFTSLRGATLGVQQQNARYRQTVFQTIQQVKQIYSAAVASRELVGVEERRLARQRDQLAFVEQQLELGRATLADLLGSQVEVNNASLTLLNAQNSARTQRFRLTEAIGSDQQVGPAIGAELDEAPLGVSREELFQVAVNAAPAVQAAEAAVEAAENSLSSARSAYIPSLSVSGGYSWSNTEYPVGNRSWSFSLGGSYPLFNGFQRETRVYQAQVNLDTSLQQRRAEMLNLSSELDAAYSSATSAQAGIGLASQSVELSEERLRVVQERYRLGMTTILELQDAQIQLTQAEADLVGRRFDYQLALASIEALLGLSIEELQTGTQ
ncbi:MAG: TolC family protein [Gemmatimonadetes bacterium]|nr:TolC family protein [Gemmatimonadota bacterium]